MDKMIARRGSATGTVTQAVKLCLRAVQSWGSDQRHSRLLIAAWRDAYNHHCPHASLDGLTPREFLNRSVKDQALNRTNF